ncbi:hypothetical protein C9374_003229 [Naegleria lovaniensis]|uniref:Guanylate cyclase domain-containing protein n=1 Tax=Naegleria lovaniensis TaxID=51637 RepID=A0AA88KJW6_NAELO|nr:uncharacterized protein C9374_003229 [Naegleria lovaniensis]KAG2386080.1 hypothetical protein C9374_003229 [Naegleria lovaniensis]
MTKVVPTSQDNTTDASGGDDRQELVECRESVSAKKPVSLAGCFSMRVVIIILIISLLLTCSLFIWLASFIGSRNTVNELTTNLIEQVGKKILVFLSGEISPIAGLARTLANDFNLGIVGRRPPFEYLFAKNVIYRPSAVGLFFPTEMYSYFNLTFFPDGIPKQTFTIYIKPKDMVGIEQWYCDEKDGSILSLAYNETKPLNIYSLAYWVTSFKYYDQLGVDGVYGDPYIVINSTACIYYTAKLYDPVAYIANRTKNVVGISKVNLSLLNIEKYLTSLSLLGRGYVLVSEYNDLVIGGSINTTALNKISRVSLFELTDKNAGKLMSDIKKQYGKMSETPQSFEINSLGIDYMIRRMEFVLENIRWNVYLIVYTEDVSKTTTINTAISAGVATAVIIVGLLLSIVIGRVITGPLTYLEKQFMKIKKFDLVNVKFTSSRFKEIDSIYEDLHEMVIWLNEFKSFLPETIFNQLRNMEGDQDKPNGKTNDSNENSKLERNETGIGSSSSAHTSSYKSNHQESKNSLHAEGGAISLFKLGLHEKDVSVVSIQICNMCKHMSSLEIGNIFAKIATGLSTLSKTMQSDLQILSVDEYQCSFVANGKKKPNVSALEAALKISKTLANILKGYEGVKVCIGVTTGKTQVGNLGTNSLRFYSIVGPLLSNVKKLLSLCLATGCTVLADSHTMTSDARNAFVSRPVERLMLENEKFDQSISSIHEIIKENSFEKDEWMYELEQQKANSRFKDFEVAFSIFESSIQSIGNNAMDHLSKSENILKEHLKNYPDDYAITNHILQIFEQIRSKTSQQNGDIASVLTTYRAEMSKCFKYEASSLSDLLELGSTTCN